MILVIAIATGHLQNGITALIEPLTTIPGYYLTTGQQGVVSMVTVMNCDVYGQV